MTARRSDPFERPLDRHLEAQRRAFGPTAYRALPDEFDRWSITCPCDPTAGHQAFVREHGEGGPLSFRCDQCNPCEVAESAAELARFFVDGLDAGLLTTLALRRDGGDWVAAVPLLELRDLLERAA